jgi:hypothetical protein
VGEEDAERQGAPGTQAEEAEAMIRDGEAYRALKPQSASVALGRSEETGEAAVLLELVADGERIVYVIHPVTAQDIGAALLRHGSTAEVDA